MYWILKLGVYLDEFYVEMWWVILVGWVWWGFICNWVKGGYVYWVESMLVLLYGEDGWLKFYLVLWMDVMLLK